MITIRCVETSLHKTLSSPQVFCGREYRTRLLSYPCRLVPTDDDDEERYVPRPVWAKAVRPVPQPLPREDEDQQLDTLSALQEEALTIVREDLFDMEPIGEGECFTCSLIGTRVAECVAICRNSYL